jgi:hypothetical protein
MVPNNGVQEHSSYMINYTTVILSFITVQSTQSQRRGQYYVLIYTVYTRDPSVTPPKMPKSPRTSPVVLRYGSLESS